MSDLRAKLHRLATEKPELREVLIPIMSMRTASPQKDLQWAADEIENALQMLEDVARVLDHRSGTTPSLSDEYQVVGALTQYLRGNVSVQLDRYQKALEKLTR